MPSPPPPSPKPLLATRPEVLTPRHAALATLQLPDLATAPIALAPSGPRAPLGLSDGALQFPALVPWTAEQADGQADWLPRIVGQPWREPSGLPTESLTEIALELRLPPRPDWPFVQRAEAAQQIDAVLVRLARGRGAIDVVVGEALAELTRGDQCLRLGFSSIGDYARERLGIAPRTAQALARLGRGLSERPVLRAAVRSGRLVARKAQAVLPVATGDEEATWTERAKRETVRALEAAVREELRQQKAAAQRAQALALRARGAELGAAQVEGAAAALEAGALDDESTDDKLRTITFEMTTNELAVLDHALDLAGCVSGPQSTKTERLEALCQEFLAARPSDREESYRDVERNRGRSERVRAALEEAYHLWRVLGPVEAAPAPDDDTIDERIDPFKLDRQLRHLMRLRRQWDELIGQVALVMTKLALWRQMGFASLGHYAEERLGMAARTLTERARLEERLASLPSLRAALRSGRLSYEHAKLVARVASEQTERAWLARAEGLTVLALRRLVTEWEDGGAGRLAAPKQRCQQVFRTGPPSGKLLAIPRINGSLCRSGQPPIERLSAAETTHCGKMCAPTNPTGLWKMCAPVAMQMCAPARGSSVPWLRKRRVRVPESTATLLWTAIDSARDQLGWGLGKGTALAVIAAHFIGVWQPTLSKKRTRSQRVLDRDDGCCQVPGCSRRAVHAHHVEYQSKGGRNDEDNLVGLCAAHHLRAVHQGWVTVTGKAPDELVWKLGVRAMGALAEYRTGPDGAVRV